ncbi:MAG: SGNH/GDSL hydrolase family protein, partial [Myxococcota bacterium]
SIGRYQLSSNPEIGYELVPHYEWSGGKLPQHVDFSGRSNSLGFRDREHDRRKPDGVYRILALGDSVTQGLMVARSELLYTSVLEQALRERGLPVEVLNLGVAGYNTQQEVATLIEKGLAFAPDLVLLQTSNNDFEPMVGGMSTQLKLEGAIAGVSTVLSRSYLYRFVVCRVLPELKRDSLWAQAEKSVRESFERLGEAQREHGFEVLVVSFPSFELTDGRIEVDERFARYADTEGFTHLELTFEPCGSWPDAFANATHPNRVGHQCAGRVIAAQLLSTQALERTAAQ